MRSESWRAFSLVRSKDSASDYQNYYDPLIRDAGDVHHGAAFPRQGEVAAGGRTADHRRSDREGRYNTLSSAYLILALDTYASLAQDTTDVSQLSIIEVNSGGQQKPLQLPTGLLPQVVFSQDARRLLVSSSSPLRTFYQVTQSGYDLRVSTDVVKQSSKCCVKSLVAMGSRSKKSSWATKQRCTSSCAASAKGRSFGIWRSSTCCPVVLKWW